MLFSVINKKYSYYAFHVFCEVFILHFKSELVKISYECKNFFISVIVGTSSILSEDDKKGKPDVVESEKSESSTVKPEAYPKTSEALTEKPGNLKKRVCDVAVDEFQKLYDAKSESSHHKSQQRRPQSQSGIFGAVFQFLRQMKCLEWSLLGGLVLGIYLTVVFNQTNIFGKFQTLSW